MTTYIIRRILYAAPIILGVMLITFVLFTVVGGDRSAEYAGKAASAETIAEIRSYVSYVGTSSPMDFNGLVRHYYLRQSDHLADIRINLAEKGDRDRQSHAIGLLL